MIFSYENQTSSSRNNFQQKASIAPSVFHPFAPQGHFLKTEYRRTPPFMYPQDTNLPHHPSATSELPHYHSSDPRLHLINSMFSVQKSYPPSPQTIKPLPKPGSPWGLSTGLVEIQLERRTLQLYVPPITTTRYGQRIETQANQAPSLHQNNTTTWDLIYHQFLHPV